MTDNIKLPKHSKHDFGYEFDPGIAPNVEAYAEAYAAEAVRLNAAPASEIRRLIADDRLAISFQTLGQYRSMLLKALAAAPEPQGAPNRKAIEAAVQQWQGDHDVVMKLAAYSALLQMVAKFAQPTAEPQGVPDERAAFEAWANGWFGPGFATRSENGQYNWPSVEDTWEVWQARAALSAPKPQGVPEPAAALVRHRSLQTEARIAHDKKDHYSEWSEWEPTTLKYAMAVTHPSRNSDPRLFEMQPLFLAAHPQQSGAAQPEQERKPLTIASQRLVLWRAMQRAAEIGNSTDDKLVVAELHKLGFCITRKE